MANELSVSINISANKSPSLLNIAKTLAASQDIAGDDFMEGTQDFTTSPAALEIGNITTAGYCGIRNTASANNLLLRIGSGGTDTIRIRPGGTFWGELNGVGFLSASTGTIKAEYVVFEL